MAKMVVAYLWEEMWWLLICKFVKIYDLSQDNISPMHYFTLLEDSIIDAVLVPILRGRLVLFVLSQHGMLYRQQIEVEGYIGAQVLAETIHLHGR